MVLQIASSVSSSLMVRIVQQQARICVCMYMYNMDHRPVLCVNLMAAHLSLINQSPEMLLKINSGHQMRLVHVNRTANQKSGDQ